MSRCPRSTTPCRPPPSGGMRPQQRATAHSTIDAGGTATVGGCRPRLSRPQIASARSTIPKRGPPPAPPKKVDYKRPQMTRAMEQRLKHTQRLQEQLERRERERSQPPPPLHPPRRLRRSAPAGSCARERRPPEDRSRCPSGNRAPSCPPDPPCPRPTTPAAPPCPPQSQQQPPAGPSGCPQTRPCSRERPQSGGVPARTMNLAKSMNAEVIQAEPLENGPIDNLIIPPGAINSEKTTVISIPQPEDHLPSSTFAHCSNNSQQQGNRSVQIISESLDEQEAAEVAMINSKLQELQQARRDFVMAVANVGGANAINLQDEEIGNLTRISEVTQPHTMIPNESSTPRLIPCLDPDDPCLRPEYGRHHPVVEAAREYLRTRQTERYIDEDFARISCPTETYRGNREERYDQEYLETIGDEDDACNQYTAIPRRDPYHYLPMPVERLERFFDVQNYPPSPHATPQSPRPPPGRECLPPDLWELEDPWYQEAEEPDLIDWDNC